MKKVLAAVCAVSVLTALASAQARPDFSGTWVFDGGKTPAAAPAGTMRQQEGQARATLSGGGTPVEYRITQTATGLTIERLLGAGAQRFVHTLDGAENVNVNSRTTIRSRSRWDGARLVTEGTETVATAAGEISSTFREVRSIDADGSMRLQTTRTAENGTTTSTRRYVKKPQ